MEDRLQKIKDGNGPLNYSETTWRGSFQREAARLTDRLVSIRAALAKELSRSALGSDDVDTLLTAIIHQRRGAMTELAEIHDLLAEALGYEKAPTLEEDPSCPCPGAYVTGDHTAGTLAMQAARTLKERSNSITAFRGLIREIDRERATSSAVDQIAELQRELAELKGTKKAELRREIEALRYACSCPYNTEMDYLARDAACPTHGDEAHNMELAGKKAIATLTYVRKYFMGSEHGHEV